MSQKPRRLDISISIINISAVPVAGIGGLGLVAAAIAMAVLLPQTRWIFIAGVITGVLFGASLILTRRRHAGRPPGDGQTMLGLRESAPAAATRTDTHERHHLRAVPQWESAR